ncbi:MAG TPA: hypothetical protein PL048_14405, partial [Leptospiraceae bacterium]|nr:hypothetical protein [Leptospiraceae bacterium]
TAVSYQAIKEDRLTHSMIYWASAFDILIMTGLQILQIFLEPAGVDYTVKDKLFYTFMFFYVVLTPIRFDSRFAVFNGIGISAGRCSLYHGCIQGYGFYDEYVGVSDKKSLSSVQHHQFLSCLCCSQLYGLHPFPSDKFCNEGSD